MFKSLFSKDSLRILKNKKLLIALTAIIFIPILYAGMFLWAFWDPYALLDDIPVAVVNEDEGYTFEGEDLKIGDELVENLKEEADFDFHFVNRAKGYRGLQAEDYYILIEIPKDFSKKATTVMDNPEKLELIYVPNESFNFLAAQMGETAMLQIQQALQEKITETYADTIFDKIDDVGVQLTDASEATEELNDGANELHDGSKEIADNLKTLSDKTGEFSDGVHTASDGTVELADGAGKLFSGVNELYGHSEKLRNASVDLHTGAGQIEDGINEVNNGVQQFHRIIDQTVGTHISGNFHNEVYDEMIDKITPVIMDKKEELHSRVNKTLNEQKNELPGNVTNFLATELAEEVSREAVHIVNETNKLIDDVIDEIVNNMSPILADYTIMAENEDQQNEEIITVLRDSEVDEQVIQLVERKLNSSSTQSLTTIEDRLREILEDTLRKIEIPQPDVDEIEDTVVHIANPLIEPKIEAAFDEVVNRFNTAFNEFDENQLDAITSEFEGEIKQALIEPIQKLQQGVDAINELADGTNQLASGAQDLVSGQSDYVSNMMRFTSSFKDANTGAGDLATGSQDLLTGMLVLQDASHQLYDGSTQLADGSNDLYDGMITLVDGTEEFNEKMDEAADEANGVNATTKSKQMIAKPVEVDNSKINEVPNYGTGFAPYFLSLGLFVGALLLSIVYPLRETSSTPTSGTEWFLRKFLVLFSIGVFQALIACGILLIGLGIEVQSISRFILYAIITSLTFITLIQFFVTCFDDPGRFIAILILILQLTTSAGTFPLELIPKVLQPLNAVLPMTYSVAGFKAVISSGDYSVMWQNAGVLLIFTTVFIALTWTYFAIKHKREYEAVQTDEVLQS